MLTSWRDAILDLVYPPKCPGCRSAVRCHGEWCCQCVRAFASSRAIDPAAHHLQFVDACWAFYDYEGSLKRVIHDMKFRKASHYRRHLTWLMEQGRLNQSAVSAHAVVPVPLHRERMRERGFNQTELIFRDWAERKGLVWLDALVRIKKTSPQWELTLASRRDNIAGAFRVNCPGLVAGKNILLVDDIFTTGLTMDECAKELKKAGAKQVYCLALASNAR